jgi:predicted  nucleic acid-binding Zn-ribbon protein
LSQENGNMADVKSKEGRTLRDVWRVVFRRKFHFFGAASVCALLVLIGSHWLPLKYTGVTKFTLRTESGGSISRASGNESLDSVKLTLQHDLLDQEALGKVLRDLGHEKGLPHDSQGALTREGQQAQQAMVAELRQHTQLFWDVRSTQVDLLSLSVIHPDPILARQIPNELVKNYIERTSGLIVERLRTRDEFLLSQVNGCRSRLTELENQRTQFEAQYAGMMPESPGVVQKRIDDLKVEIDKLSRDRLSADDKLREVRSKLVRLDELFPQAVDSLPAQDANRVKVLVASYRKSQPASGPATGPATELASGADSQPATTQPTTQPAEEEPVQIVKGPNPERKKLEDQIRDAEQALDSMHTMSHMTDGHPKIQALKARIEQLKKQVEETPAEVVTQKIYANPAHQPNTPKAQFTDPRLAVAAMDNALREWNLAALDYKRFDEDLNVIKTRRDETVAMMANFAAVRQKWGELTKKVDECADELKRWQDQHNDIQIALAAEVAKKRTHMETVQPAQEQFLPSWPPLSYVLGGALLAALAGGTGLVLLLNLLDRTITTTDKAAEMFNLPVHGVIGEIVTARQRRRRKIWRWLGSPTICTVVLIGVVIAALSITLRLQFPEMYAQWKSDPLAVTYNGGVRVAKEISNFVKQF